MKKYLRFLFPGLILIAFMFHGCAEYSRLFVGGASKPGQKGETVFGVFDFNKTTGDLVLVTEYDARSNSTSFCYSEKNKLIYVLNEVMDFKGLAGGGLTTLKFDPGKVTFEKKSEIVVPYGGPCHLSISPDGGFIFVANYTTGSVAVVKLDDEGIPALVSDTIRYDREGDARPRAHMIKADPAGKHVFVTDLGLDRVYIYDFDKTSGSLRQDTRKTIMIPKGYGPRHFVFNADGSKLYLINE
jgi:6-phosphogluconolactonase (cycloisomerase 2 family)